MAEHSAVPVSPSSLIKPGGTNFSSMQSLDDLHRAESKAPDFHRRTLDALKATGKVRDDGTQQRSAMPSSVTPTKPRGFKIGVRVMNKAGKKLTIIQAQAGYTKKTKTPVHRVADRQGESWLERETDLQLLP